MRGLDHVIALDQSEVRNVGVRSVRRSAAVKRNRLSESSSESPRSGSCRHGNWRRFEIRQIVT